MRNFLMGLMGIALLTACHNNLSGDAANVPSDQATDDNGIVIIPDWEQNSYETPHKFEMHKMTVDLQVRNREVACQNVKNLIVLFGGYTYSYGTRQIVAFMRMDKADAFVENLGQEVGKIKKFESKKADRSNIAQDVEDKLAEYTRKRAEYTKFLENASDTQWSLEMEQELKKIDLIINALNKKKKNMNAQPEYVKVTVNLQS